MTTRSTRRAAEVTIIDAAYAYTEAEAYLPLTHPDMVTYVLRLGRAVKAHEALGLELPDRAAFSNNSTDTSAAAGASLKNIAGMARTCFDEIVLAGGLTVDQLTIMLNGKHQSISARVNQLRNSGWVVDSGIKRLTRSKRTAIVWRPSEQALRQQ